MISRPLIILLVVFTSNLLTAQDDPFIFVLGVAQDAGYPQAGCYQPHCLPGWENAELRQGATSLAVVDPVANSKYLFEATPHLPEQLYNLERIASDTSYSLEGIFLTHAHIGHYTGLMFFGFESMNADNLPVYAMPRMIDYLSTNGPWSQLITMNNIVLRELRDQQPVTLSNVTVTPILVPHRDEFSETVGYQIRGPNKTALFIPDINKWEIWDRSIIEEIRAVDYALVDATFFDGNEIPGRNIADFPHPFVIESMELFEELAAEDKAKVWFIHLNHSNPLLNRESEAYQRVTARGFNVAREGDRLPL
ncbi:MAG: MBL fold metallo-hydrolase [Gammaproteobacteria bacterium]|jgi:pyrroloquinoline quinone biosynthesis protein B|nr:MBL fold metallo-hydrolase [Gammaproteobacteria bacterium]